MSSATAASQQPALAHQMSHEETKGMPPVAENGLQIQQQSKSAGDTQGAQGSPLINAADGPASTMAQSLDRSALGGSPFGARESYEERKISAAS